MKQGHFLMVFLFIACSCFVSLYVVQKKYDAIKEEEEKVTPGGEVVEESNNNIMDNRVGVPSDNVEGVQGMGEEIEGQIPTEVLQELLTLAQEQPEVFREVLQNYPELAQMLQQDINGGMM